MGGPEAHGLIDTGAILAILDRRDEWHTRCVETLGALRLPFATTAACSLSRFRIVPGRMRS